ncbi:MAG: hypothetical protein ACJA2E_000250 [Arenicella sp.]|jgi:hypothetical protein
MSDVKKQHNTESKQHETLSTLELWQAHLRALRRASNQSTHTVEIFDTNEQSSSTILVKLASEDPTA